VCVCVCVCKKYMYVCVYLQVRVCICMHVLVCVLAARIRVTGPVSPHLPQAELLICTSLSAGLTNAIRQLGALCAGKRRDNLAPLTGFCENVTFHQAAIYRLLLLLRENDCQLVTEGDREKRQLKHEHA